MSARHPHHPHHETIAGLHVVFDLAIAGGAYAAAYALRAALTPQFGRYPYDVRELWWVPLVGAAAWLLSLRALGLYASLAGVRPLEILRRTAVAALAVTALLGLAIFAGQAKEFSRPVAVLYVGFAAVGIAAERLALRALALRSEHGARLRTLVVGTGASAARVASDLGAEERAGRRTHVGFLDAGETPCLVDRARIRGRADELARILDGEPIDEVILALPTAFMDVAERAILVCGEVGVRASLVLPVAADPARARLATVAGATAIRWDPWPHGPLDAALKRALDVVVSAALLLALAPLFLAIAALVRLTSRGPAFFVQRRVGLYGREFRLYKFRTMEEGAEEKQPALAPCNEADGPAFKMRHDPRTTPFGRWLRRWSLDELPQLWNVLRGDMSLVGPRPPIPAEVARYERWQRRRLSVRPGITGLWQVSGRSDVGFGEWMRLDLAYIDRWSLALDLCILGRTIGAVLARRGSY